MSTDPRAPSPPYHNLQRRFNQYKTPNVHELQKLEIRRQGSDTGYNTRQSISTASMETDNELIAAGFQDIELCFDSTARNMESDIANGEIAWDIPKLSLLRDIQNCIQLHVDHFYFPKVYAPPTAPEFFYFRRMFMELLAVAGDQCALGPHGNRYHFEFDIQNIIAGQAVHLIPVKDQRSFFFNKPINSISKFAVLFKVPPTDLRTLPWKRVPIPPETAQIRMLLNAGVGYNPARFEIIPAGPQYNTLSLLGPIGSTGAPGLAIFITGFSSGDPAVDAQINTPDGLFIANILDDTTFELATVDTTTVVTQPEASMFIPKNVIRFSFRFTTVSNDKTNYIGVTHH